MLNAKIIHLATHGLLNELKESDVPGAIALAASQTDDGLLTSSEILDLQLQAELVVLSACNTGRGMITGDGDWIVSLSDYRRCYECCCLTLVCSRCANEFINDGVLSSNAGKS